MVGEQLLMRHAGRPVLSLGYAPRKRPEALRHTIQELVLVPGIQPFSGNEINGNCSVLWALE